jgi:hypothetical protein
VNTETDDKSREELEREADLVRSKLLHTVERLDQRRHDALDLRLQVRRHLGQLALAAGLLVLVSAGVVTLVVHRVATAAERRRRARWRLARTVWHHPERAIRAERGPLYAEIARSIAIVLATHAVTIPARRLLGHVLGRTPPAEAR